MGDAFMIRFRGFAMPRSMMNGKTGAACDNDFVSKMEGTLRLMSLCA